MQPSIPTHLILIQTSSTWLLVRFPLALASSGYLSANQSEVNFVFSDIQTSDRRLNFLNSRPLVNTRESPETLKTSLAFPKLSCGLVRFSFGEHSKFEVQSPVLHLS